MLILSWTRFSFVLAVVGLGFAFVIFPTLIKDGWSSLAAAVIFFGTSMMLFFTYRFRQLRASVGPVSHISNSGELAQKFLGPIVPFIFWFFGTVIASIGILLGGILWS